MPSSPPIPAEVLEAWGFAASNRVLTPVGHGLINQSWRLSDRHRRRCGLLQKINLQVFPDADALMQNLSRVTRHLAGVVPPVPAFRVIDTNDGQLSYRDKSGGCWRLLSFIADGQAPQSPTTTQQAGDIARAFAGFVSALATLPVSCIHTVIADFHHPPRRLADLRDAWQRTDATQRTAEMQRGYDFACAQHALVAAWQSAAAQLPLRLVHNDTKTDNVLLDSARPGWACVVDLDTVMPGQLPLDFGDMLRSMASRHDEADMPSFMASFEAAACGYLEGLTLTLTDTERVWLARSPRLVALELGMRFLTDHLAGDRYFKVAYRGENLARAKRQFDLCQYFAANEPQFTDTLYRYHEQTRHQ